MSTQQDHEPVVRNDDIRKSVSRAVAGALAALEQLAGGLGTAVMAFVVLLGVLATVVLCAVGIGLLLIPTALRAVRGVANRERARLSRYGSEMPEPASAPVGLRAAVSDPVVRRELGWLVIHGSAGLVLGLIGVALTLFAVRDAGVGAWWWLLPEGAEGSVAGGGAGSWGEAGLVTLLGLGWVAIIVGLGPGLARVQAWPGRCLLGPGPGTDLSLRVAQLTATRAAALDAHAVELRRIERSLHDGTQNRLVAVTVLLGAAQRAMDRDTASARELLERAQDAAELALGELRAVARGILPPVLSDRGLAGALTGLAATSPVPCTVALDASVTEGRCAASVEATAYFVVAEALTNTARHSGAQHVAVTLRRRGDRLHVQVTDDGHGGADGSRGSGLVGIRRRVEGHDGSFTVTSPPGGPTTLDVEVPCGS